MADVLIEYKGKRTTISDDDPRYDAIMARPDVKIVEEDVYEADGAAPADGEEDDFAEPKVDGDPDSAAAIAARAGRKIDAFSKGANKFMIGGFTDATAGAGAALGTLGQATVDKLRGFDTHPIDQAREAHTAAAAEQRGEEEKAYRENPGLYGAGAVTGALVGAKAIPTGPSKLSTLGRNVAAGGATGFGLSEADDVYGDMQNLLLGAGLGGGATIAAPLIAKIPGVSRALSALDTPVSKVPSAIAGAVRGAAGKVGNVAGKVVDVAEASPILRGAAALGTSGASEAGLGAARILKGMKPAPVVPPADVPAQTLDDFVRSMPDEAAPALRSPPPSIDDALSGVPPAPEAAPAMSFDEAAAGVDDATKALSPADEAAQSLDEVDRGLRPAVTPTDPTIIKQRTPAAEAALPQRGAKGGADFDADLAEAQKIVREGVPDFKGKRTPDEWRLADDSEKIAAIEDAARAAVKGRRLPNQEALRSATGLDKKDFARLYPEIRKSLIPPAPVKAQKSAKTSQMRAAPKSPVEAATNDVDDIAEALGGSPILETPPTAGVQQQLPDPDLLDALIRQGSPPAVAVRQARAIAKPKPKKMSSAERARAPFLKK